MQQINSTVEFGHDRQKYEVNQLLVFIGNSPSEDIKAEFFSTGDILCVAERNGCGMGIDVVNITGQTDMVWPEEVELYRPAA